MDKKKQEINEEATVALCRDSLRRLEAINVLRSDGSFVEPLEAGHIMSNNSKFSCLCGNFVCD